MAKYFKTPFAKNGDRVSVPESTQVDGSVSFEQGYGIDYERDQDTDPQAKDIGRDSFNGIFHDMTEAVGEIQSSGVAQWISGVSYPKGALVWRNKVLHLSISDANTSAPPSDKWTILYDKSNTTVDKNNFIRAAGDKTTVITDDITHDTNETSREKVASAELVSKKITGGNVVQTTGQSTVDVMSQKTVTNLVIRNNFQDVTSSRVLKTIYTNNTLYPIDVMVSFIFTGVQKIIFESDGVQKIISEIIATGTSFTVCYVETIMPSSSYSLYSDYTDQNSIINLKWYERTV